MLDIGLPRLNGYEVARRIRATATSPPPDAGRADRLGTGGGPAPDVEAGFDHHLVKPVDFDALKALLAEPAA